MEEWWRWYWGRGRDSLVGSGIGSRWVDHRCVLIVRTFVGAFVVSVGVVGGTSSSTAAPVTGGTFASIDDVEFASSSAVGE